MNWYLPADWTPYLYAVLAPIYDGFAWRVSRDARRTAARLLDVQDGDTVLVAGCGTGLSIPLIAEKVQDVNIIGVDRSPEMLQRAQRRVAGKPGATVRHANILALPYHNDTFDAVLSAYVLDLLPPPQRVDALRELKRVTRPGARLVTVTPGLPERPDEQLWDLLVRILPIALGGGQPADLTSALQESGWRIEASRRTRNLGLASHLLSAVRV